MALEFICSNNIEFGEMIKIPYGANYYIRKSKTNSSKKGRNPRVNFFNVNSLHSLRMKKIFRGAKHISFDIEEHKYNIEYGKPCFYDYDGNKILKRENE